MNEHDKGTIQRDNFTLSHKHFCFIAAALAETRPQPDWDNSVKAQWQCTVNAFVAACKRSNGRFNADRFIEACNHER